MKKLMTTIAAATAAFGLFAAEPVTAWHGASMETGDNYVVGEGVFGEDVWDGCWVTDGDDESVVTAYEGGEALPNLNYNVFEGADQLNYLKVEAEKPLYRALQAVTGTTTDFLIPTDIEGEDEEGNKRDGIIIDQLVKFSAFDAETEKIDVEAGAKIAVWVKAGEEEDGKGTLQITTAKLNADTFEPEPQTINTAIEVDTAEWHQLKITTIKAAEIDNKVAPGFIVELDGEVIAKATEDLWPVVEPWDACLTDAAKELIAQNKLFPSMVKYTLDNAGTLFGVAYKGTGAIDDVAVADYVAEVPPAPTYDITIEKPENGTLETSVTNDVAAGVTVTVTATPDEGYELEMITVNGAPLAEGETEFVMPAENVTVAATFKEAKQDWPEDWKDIDADQAVKDKFAAWRAGVGADADLSTDAAKNAFLLNCSVDDIKDLKIESIEVDADGYAAIVVSAPGDYGFNLDLGEINGVLFVEAGETLETMTEKAVTDWITTSGKAVVKIQANFIKAVIGFKTPEVPADTIKVGEVEE